MLQAEILDMALSHVNSILHMINDPESVKEYEIKRHQLEELLEIEREKHMRIVKKIIEGAKYGDHNMTDTQIRDTEFDVIKRLQNGAIELLAIELRDTELSDTITRGEVITDLEHRLEYLTQQVAKIKEYNEELKGAAK